jgi:DNA-directed RNA polymerase specialized sigma24 family protein
MPPVDQTQTHASFTVTRWSQVALAGGASPAARMALDWLCRTYWEPLRIHAARRGWRDAEDAVQDFWVSMLERGSLATADEGRGRFRTWLLCCLDHHLADRHAARQTAKRGAGKVNGALPDDDLIPSPAHGDSASHAFDRAWAMTLLSRARERFVAEHTTPAGRERLSRLDRFLDVNGDVVAYASAAADLRISEGAVKVAVHRLRMKFRDCLRAEVAETLAEPSPAAIDAELDDLLTALGRM